MRQAQALLRRARRRVRRGPAPAAQRGARRRPAVMAAAPAAARWRGSGGPARWPWPTPSPSAAAMRGREVALGLGHRLRQRPAAGQEGGDRGRERAAGAVRVAGGDALALEPVDARRRGAGGRGCPRPSRWPPLSRTLRGPSACRRAATPAHLPCAVRAAGSPSSTPASGRLGVIRLASGRRRARERVDRVVGQELVAALRHHHGVEHDPARPPVAQAVGHGGDRSPAPGPACRS